MATTVDLEGLCRDYFDERASLRALLVGLDEPAWQRPTPARRWTVLDQAHGPADSDLIAVGPVAQAWLPIAQAFARPPCAGRRAGQFA